MATPNKKRVFKDVPFVTFENDDYIKQEVPGYCGVCGRKTRYKSSYAAEYCCSEECASILWYQLFYKLLTERRGGKK